MSLDDTYVELRDALTPLGIDFGREVLDVWHDRASHGRQPLPSDSIRRLADLTTRLLAYKPATGCRRP